jgi:uncharacterized membrane protein
MPKSVPRGVSLLLANISLVDLVAALPLALMLSALLEMPEGWFFALTSALAFGIALLLQKVTPAT